MDNKSNLTAVGPSPGLQFNVPPRNQSRCIIGGPRGLVIESPAPVPNRFWRVMQRWCLGIVWEILPDDNQPK